jgi:hypothetical protein
MPVRRIRNWCAGAAFETVTVLQRCWPDGHPPERACRPSRSARGGRASEMTIRSAISRRLGKLTKIVLAELVAGERAQAGLWDGSTEKRSVVRVLLRDSGLPRPLHKRQPDRPRPSQSSLGAGELFGAMVLIQRCTPCNRWNMADQLPDAEQVCVDAKLIKPADHVARRGRVDDLGRPSHPTTTSPVGVPDGWCCAATLQACSTRSDPSASRATSTCRSSSRLCTATLTPKPPKTPTQPVSPLRVHRGSRPIDPHTRKAGA